MALILLALVSGCGGGDDGETSEQRRAGPEGVGLLAVTLAGSVGPESAGIMMAEHEDYFADEGLDVEILAPGSPLSPVRYVVSEEDDFGVSHQPEVMLAQAKGAPVTTFGSLIPRPTAAMIWLKKSKIRGIADLKGKTVAIPGLPFQEDLLEVVLARAGLTLEDVRLRRAEYELVSNLENGDADAIFGGSANVEGIELESAGLDPVVTPVSDLGIPPYEELVMIARTDFASRHPQVLRDFMAAVRRGTAAAIEDPETAARVIDTDWESVWGTGREEMEAEVEATLPLLSETGYTSPAWAKNLASWMRDRGWIPGDEKVAE